MRRALFQPMSARFHTALQRNRIEANEVSKLDEWQAGALQVADMAEAPFQESACAHAPCGLSTRADAFFVAQPTVQAILPDFRR